MGDNIILLENFQIWVLKNTVRMANTICGPTQI